MAQALPQYREGLLRAIGISSEQRYPSVPEIPTFKEQGVDLVANEWYGLLAPAGTPKPIIEKLNTEMKRIMALPDAGFHFFAAPVKFRGLGSFPVRAFALVP